MRLEQFTAAAAAARSVAALDETARLGWRAYGEGLLDESAAAALAEAIEARRRLLGSKASLSASKPASARPKPCKSPDRQRSLERRRRWAASGAMPPAIASAFTVAEQAALAVVCREAHRKGSCQMPVDQIAAIAGVSRSTVKNALREARLRGWLSVQERRRAGQRSLTNIIAVTSSEWLTWLRLARGGGVKKMTTTNTQVCSMEKSRVPSTGRQGHKGSQIGTFVLDSGQSKRR